MQMASLRGCWPGTFSPSPRSLAPRTILAMSTKETVAGTTSREWNSSGELVQARIRTTPHVRLDGRERVRPGRPRVRALNRVLGSPTTLMVSARQQSLDGPRHRRPDGASLRPGHAVGHLLLHLPALRSPGPRPACHEAPAGAGPLIPPSPQPGRATHHHDPPQVPPSRATDRLLPPRCRAPAGRPEHDHPQRPQRGNHCHATAPRPLSKGMRAPRDRPTHAHLTGASHWRRWPWPRYRPGARRHAVSFEHGRVRAPPCQQRRSSCSTGSRSSPEAGGGVHRQRALAYRVIHEPAAWAVLE